MRGERTSLLFVAIAVPVLLVGLVIAVLIPLTEAPEEAADDPYERLSERRAERADLRAEPQPPSVLGRSEGVEGDAEQEPVFDAPVERFRIGRIDVDAPVIVMNIDANGYMEAPSGPEPVAWYDFTAKPGQGNGNAVLSGHLDYRGHGPAVFWDLEKLEPGDEIEIELADGTRLHYAVTGSETYAVTSIDMEEVLAETSDETVTLITCAGDFVNGDYTHRLVVRGERTGVEPGS